jgi:hypothetical protein
MRMKLLHTRRAKSRWQCGQGRVLDLFPDCFLLSLPPPPEDGDVSMRVVVFNAAAKPWAQAMQEIAEIRE